MSGPPKSESLEGPVCHQERPSETTPLVWVGDSESASSDLLMRVAVQAGGAPPPESEPGGSTGAFGARQRGWLTRLTWSPSPARERRLIVSSTFLDERRLSALAQEMSDEGHAIPEGADGVVDGLTPVGDVMFYALFEGPEPWTAVPLMPLPPPFEGVGQPVLLGEAEARLRRWADGLQAGTLDATGRELVDAALAVITGDRR